LFADLDHIIIQYGYPIAGAYIFIDKKIVADLAGYFKIHPAGIIAGRFGINDTLGKGKHSGQQENKKQKTFAVHHNDLIFRLLKIQSCCPIGLTFFEMQQVGGLHSDKRRLAAESCGWYVSKSVKFLMPKVRPLVFLLIPLFLRRIF